MKRFAIVLAAGQGKRMKSKLYKVLHPVCGKPMVGHVVQTVQQVNCERSVVVVGHGAEAVRTYLQDAAEYVLQEQQRVLIVDDFMKAGGTIQGMVDLLGEFNAEVAGVGVLVESGSVETEERLLEDYISLAVLSDVDSKTKRITVKPGNYFEN